MKPERFPARVTFLMLLLALTLASIPAWEVRGTGSHYGASQPNTQSTTDPDRVAGPVGGIVASFPICTEGHSQGHPWLEFDPIVGQFLVIWHDFRTNSAVLGSPVRFVEPHVGPEFAIEDYPGYQPMAAEPALAYNATTHQFLAVWHDVRNSSGPSGVDIYGRLVNVDSVTSPELPISTAPGAQTRPAAAHNSTANQFLVAYEDTRLELDSDIYGRILNADGSTSGDEFPLSIVTENQASPAVGHGVASNQYLVVWEDSSYAAPLIMGRFVDADGTLGVFEFAVAPTSGAQSDPDVVYNPSTNQFLVVWQNGSNIYGRLVNADGSIPSEAFAICSAEGTQRHPAAAYNPITGHFLVVWEDDRNWDDIYGRLVSGDGSMASEEAAIATTSTHLEVPRAAYSPAADRFLVVWKHEYCTSLYDCEGYDIYGAFLSEIDMPGTSPGRSWKVYLPAVLRDLNQ